MLRPRVSSPRQCAFPLNSMTLKELAEYLRVSADKLTPYLKVRGKTRIVARKVGGRWEITPESAQDWLLAVYEEQIERNGRADLPRSKAKSMVPRDRDRQVPPRRRGSGKNRND